MWVGCVMVVQAGVSGWPWGLSARQVRRLPLVDAKWGPKPRNSCVVGCESQWCSSKEFFQPDWALFNA